MLTSLARDFHGPLLPLTIDEALTACIVELVEDERGVVGLWQAHPVSQWADTGTMSMLGFLRRRDGRPALIVHTFNDVGDITDLARSMVSSAMTNVQDPPRSTECPGLIHYLLRLGIAKLPSGRPGDDAIGMAQYVSRRTGIDLTAAHRVVRDHLGPQIERMIASLDAEALAFAADRAQTLNWIGEREWEGIDATFTPGAPFRKAIEAFPGFAALFMRKWKEDRPAFGDDPAQSLQAALRPSEPGREANCKSLARSIAKHGEAISKAGLAARAHNYLFDIDPFFRAPPKSVELRAAMTLAILPSDWVPDSAGEWDAMLSISDPMATVRHMAGISTSLVKLFPVGGRWHSYRSRLLKAAGVSDPKALGTATSDICDYRDAFGREILGPAYALTDLDADRLEDATARDLKERASQTTRSSGAILLRGKSFARILEDSREWHHKQHAIAAQISSITPGFLPMTAWPAGLPDWKAGGYDLQVLTCTRELKAEGSNGPDDNGMMGLSHCVGGYSQQCKSNRSRIVSLRRMGQDGLAERVSTAEIAVRHEGAGTIKFTIIQHRAHRNEDPPNCAQVAVETYLAALESGELIFDQSQLLPSKSIGTIAQNAGYEFWRPGAFDAAVEAWSPFLTKSMRKWSHKDFAALPNLS